MRMIADTNVLLRFVLGDDPEQYKLALDSMEKSEAVAVTNHALCEMALVLRSRYGVSRAAIAATIRGLLETRNVVLDSAAVNAGLTTLDAGADFADGVIDYEGRWLGGETFVSFDKKAVAAIAKQGQRAKLLG
ncbi:MAG: type II toxin-antitoxin system VapC family toxin [Terracidiphilus sp.]